MITILTKTDIISLYLENDEVYKNMNFIDKYRINKRYKKVIESIGNDRFTKMVCDNDSISYGLKLCKYFNKPITLVMDQYQYLSTSEFWRDYVCFK